MINEELSIVSPESNQPERVIVLFWYPNELTTRAATSLYYVHGKTPKDFHRTLKDMPITDFFKKLGVSLKQAMMEFPDYIVPTSDSVVKDWDDTPLMWQRIPETREELQRLVDMVNLPMSVYEYPGKRQKPKHLFDLDPAIEASFSKQQKITDRKKLNSGS